MAATASAHATDVVVRVSGVVGSAGFVRVAICRPDGYLQRRGVYKTEVPATPGVVEITLPGVAAGRYAVIAHHDRSGDGVVHKNWLGIPTDGVGVSRNVEGRFGPPAFDDVALDISGPRVVINIVLKREPAG